MPSVTICNTLYTQVYLYKGYRVDRCINMACLIVKVVSLKFFLTVLFHLYKYNFFNLYFYIVVIVHSYGFDASFGTNI